MWCQAARRPHHSYVLAGPEGCGKQLAARAFALTESYLATDPWCGYQPAGAQAVG